MNKIVYVAGEEDAKLWDVMPDFSQDATKYIYENLITKKSVIADIGSGTGRLSKEFLKNGNQVYCIEPDIYMKSICDKKYGNLHNYKSVVGYAENTTLEDHSIDLITVAQALHRIDVSKFREEAKRILKNMKNILIVYSRIDFSNPVLNDLLQALKNNYPTYKSRYGDGNNEAEMFKKEYIENCKEVDELLEEKAVVVNFENELKMNREDFKKLVLSLELFPILTNDRLFEIFNNDIDVENFKKEIDEIFNKYQENGKISFPFPTDIHFSKSLIKE